MEVFTKDQISKKKWEELIGTSESTYFFHTPEWIELLENAFGFKDATRMYVVDDYEILIPMVSKNRFLLFNTLHSLPQGYGGIFANQEVPCNVLKDILLKIPERNIFSLRIHLPPFFYSKVIDCLNNPLIKDIKSMWSYTHILEMKHPNFVLEKLFDKKRRWAINKAEKFGFEISEGKTKEDFTGFYDILRESCIRWGYKEPVHPKKLYTDMIKYRKNVNLYIAQKRGQTTAGLITLNYGNTVFYWISAFVDEFREYSPTSLLLKKALERSYNQNFKIFNFGASGNLEGVRKFKESFGAERVELKTIKIMDKYVLRLSNLLKKV